MWGLVENGWISATLKELPALRIWVKWPFVLF